MIDRSKIPYDDLTDHEKFLVMRSELRKKRYVPDSDEEGTFLARQLLGEELFRGFEVLRAEIACRYNCSPRWGACSGWKLFYRYECGGNYLCGICVDERRYAARIRLGRRERDMFEMLRDTFPRDTVQWMYDFAPVQGGVKHVLIDPELCGVDAVFRILALCRVPDRLV